MQAVPPARAILVCMGFFMLITHPCGIPQDDEDYVPYASSRPSQRQHRPSQQQHAGEPGRTATGGFITRLPQGTQRNSRISHAMLETGVCEHWASLLTNLEACLKAGFCYEAQVIPSACIKSALRMTIRRKTHAAAQLPSAWSARRLQFTGTLRDLRVAHQGQVCTP